MLRLTIPTMTCGGCARAVTRIVQEAAGPETPVEIDLATREVRIDASPATEFAIRAALAKGGYNPEPREMAALG
ncbi:MAG TPA: heavy-metal-associated domain-containing protein [Microvirga sp.]|jgi:copper chaperone|nr:heavy-metal-associated domain-containing protein [Microvirga sp.]